MAGGVEAGSLLLTLTVCGSSGCGAFRPPLRQAAGRYATYTLLRWSIESGFYDIIMLQEIYIMCGGNKMGNCVNCDKETDNKYEYYIANEMGRNTAHSGNYDSEGNYYATSTETIAYSNIEYQWAYLCKKCRKLKIGYFIGELIGGIFFAALWAGFVILGIRAEDIKAIIISSAILGSLTMFVFIRGFITTPKKVGSEETIKYLREKNKEINKVYFTPEEYKTLRK